MRIEQRIGRIDRYGQLSEAVAIMNLVTPGTVDGDIYERCLWRIGVFQHAVGGNEEILGTITREIHDIAESYSLNDDEKRNRLRQMSDNVIRQLREEEDLENKQSELFGLDVPKPSWRDDVEAAETFWLSSAAIVAAVEAYLSGRLDSEGEHLLGAGPLKTLRLSQESRAALLTDFHRLPRSVDPISRDWEKWLKGGQPTLAVTFNQESATENPKAIHVSVIHPLVRQAARFLDVDEPQFCAMELQSVDLPVGDHPFALYRWTKHGVRPDEALVAIAADKALENSMLNVLALADHVDLALPDPEIFEGLELRHHAKWVEAQANHIDGNRQLVEHRVQSLTVSHRARSKVIEDQIGRATNDKIRIMRQGELARANADFDRRIIELEQAISGGDVRASPIVFGVMRVVKAST